MTLEIYPSSPAPDVTLPFKQQMPRIVAESEYGYKVIRPLTEIAPRNFQLTYNNLPYAEMVILRNFIIKQNYGLTPFLFKHPTKNITEYDAVNQDGVLELTAESVGSLAQGFQFPFQNAIHKVQLYLNKIGSPSGQLSIKINTDSSGVPSSSTLVTSDNVAVSSITGTLALVEFNFSTSVRLSAFTQYHLVLEGDSTYDSSFSAGVTAVQLGVDTTSPSYLYGNISTYASSTWTADTSKAGIFVIPDYTKVETQESAWNEQQISNAQNGIFELTMALMEQL